MNGSRLLAGAGKQCLPMILFLLLPMIAGCSQLQGISPTEAPLPQTVPAENHVAYRNTEIGFSFSLPASWEGFSIREGVWEGLTSGDSGDVVVAEGLMLYIVHPQSTPQHPRQEIPLMVFTIEQWGDLQSGEWHVGAAPIGPLELGRNSHYVLALPARYNYTFPEGWEEAEEILQGQPLEMLEPGAAS